MRTTKLLLSAAALLIILAPLAYLALWWPTRKKVAQLDRLGRSVAYTKPLYREYREGGYARAKAAMLEVVRHLEEYEAESIGRDGEFRNEDAMLAYVRLANLEAKHGGSQGAEFMREAVARCERLRWRKGQGGSWRRGCDEPTLRGLVEQLDANFK